MGLNQRGVRTNGITGIFWMSLERVVMVIDSIHRVYLVCTLLASECCEKGRE